MTANAGVLEAPRRAADLRRAPFEGAWLLAGATVLSGAMTYAFHVIAARTLGPASYGQIAVLWGALVIAAVLLFRPLEQTTSSACADRLARGLGSRSVLRMAATLYLAIAVGIVVTAALAWTWITDRLFLGDNVMTAALVFSVAAYGFGYLIRGAAAGHRWFAGYAWGLLADATARLAIASLLLVVASKDIAAAAIVAAGLASVLLPLYLGRAVARDAFGARRESVYRISSASRFVLPAGVIAVSDQVLVNAGPVLVMLGGGSSETAGLVFAATMLVRVPVYLFQGLAASLLPNLTRLHAIDELHRVRRTVTSTSLAVGGVGAGIALAAAVAGPTGMHILYGDEYAVGRAPLTLLGAGVGLYLVGATFSQGLLALGRVRSAAVGWALAAVLFLTLYAVLPGSALDRIALALALAALAGCGVLATALWRGLRRA